MSYGKKSATSGSHAHIGERMGMPKQAGAPQVGLSVNPGMGPGIGKAGGGAVAGPKGGNARAGRSEALPEAMTSGSAPKGMKTYKEGAGVKI